MGGPRKVNPRRIGTQFDGRRFQHTRGFGDLPQGAPMLKVPLAAATLAIFTAPMPARADALPPLASLGKSPLLQGSESRR